jgi:YesN/AraC family two-component response regulator
VEGLRKVSEHKPDLIITDWIMPVMDGATFIKELRSGENTATIPIILLTAKDEVQDRQVGLDLGADQVISKPFNIQLLKSQLKRTIENNRIRLRKFSQENLENLVQVQESRDANFIEEVERIIRGNILDSNLNAGLIARELGISRTSLYDRIKSITGYTMGEYMQQIRLKHAIKLMLFEDVSVSEVYVMVGFSSISYFIRLFKKYYQATPKEYIKNYLRTTSN